MSSLSSCQTTLRLNNYSKVEIVKKTSSVSGEVIKEKQNFRNRNKKGRKSRFLALFNFDRFPCPALHAFPG